MIATAPFYANFVLMTELPDIISIHYKTFNKNTPPNIYIRNSKVHNQLLRNPILRTSFSHILAF